MTLGSFFHYGSIAGTIACSALGISIGLSYIAKGAIDALYTQPSAHKEISKISILAMALTETGGVIGLTVSLMLFITTLKLDNTLLYPGLARFGIFFTTGLVSLFVGIVSALPARQACLSVARQPFFSTKIMNLLLITMSIVQTPIIFGFLAAVMINSQANTAESIGQALAILSAGVCLGIGSIGPAYGQSIYAAQACETLGNNRDTYRGILTFSLISQAMIESPIIFALLITLVILGTTSNLMTPIQAVVTTVAGFCVGINNIATGISSGRTAAAASKQITHNLSSYTAITRTSLIAQGLIDTFAIYGLLIGLLLLFLGK
ncbi:hypothetical protein A3F06_03550 [candidate division TM6 bacterium RIFCSPHIGHO2_12_FULL_36_22]|nr:MAG: hypothetical protein A3F06_03550 [candidate division TM6 bacterium RIFCSPHIGHO2_12_FULL_36_22]